jgi:hypothetical protein
MLSHFCYNAQPFCYNARSFYDFVSHSHPVMHFATVLNHFMTLSAILEVPSVILVQCLSILQNSLIVLKIPSAILSNDCRRLTGAEGGSRLDWEVLGRRAARARARGGTQLDRACSGSQGRCMGAGWLDQLVGLVGLGDAPLVHHPTWWIAVPYIYILYIYESWSSNNHHIETAMIRATWSIDQENPNDFAVKAWGVLKFILFQRHYI